MSVNAIMIDSKDQPEALSRRSSLKDKLHGKIEEAKGKLTGDKSEELKGKGRQTVGGVKEAGKEIAYDAEHPDRPEDDLTDR
jgi:uncharacterized protein YjbJ (UPF0337 family)